MIVFKRQYSLKNGNKLNKNNWHRVVVISTKPCTNILGVPAIEREKEENGAYYEKYYLKLEAEGYIFREINSGYGISGHHSTYREAIWSALSISYFQVFING